MKYVVRLDEITMADLGLVGTKAARLGELTRAGFPVPPGFCVTVAAFESCCRLQADSGRLEIGEIPPDIAREIIDRCTSLGHPAVAVRSSATAEDTREFSFAGQYESFLQIVGTDHLLRAIRDCWASLWSPRAVGYRERVMPGGAPPAMGVIVQAMVPARASGVMFTANPVTSDREEIVITANPGLATLVVSGRVTPDTYRLDKAKVKVRERYIAEKGEMEVAEDAATRVVPVPGKRRRAPTLTRRQCSELGRLGLGIEGHFGAPQDIEFVHDGRRFFIVQSRPITGLVSWAKKGTFLARSSMIELMPRPVSPLFETTYLPLGAEVLRRVARESGVALPPDAGQLVTINGYVFGQADPSTVHILSALRLPSVRAYRRYLANLWKSGWRRTELAQYQRTVAKWKDLDAQRAEPATLWEGIIDISRANADFFRTVMFNRMSGQIETVFTRLYPFVVPEEHRVPLAMLLRGHDSEVTRAEKEAHALSQAVREDAGLRKLLVESPAAEVEARLGQSPAGRAWLSRFHEYLARNGFQISNLDFMEPTLGECPALVLARIRLFLTDEARLPRVEQARRDRLAAEARLKSSLGPVRRAVVSSMLALLDYGQVLREDVLFFLGLGWPVVRRFILELGARMVRNGLLDDRADVFFVTAAELQQAFHAQPDVDGEQMKRNVRQRRERWKQNQALKPPALLPGLFTLFGLLRLSRWMPEYGAAGAGNGIRGIPVSPGRVTAPASVVHSIEEFDRMKAGNVLVAPMTSPAWTPLLAMAAAVVTDIGGVLSHASIVAREYGIPAVIGTGVASHRIADGQVVTVDGDSGRVTINDLGDRPY
jgi:phosphohistidine swiveling domain-containing protein